MMVACKPLSGGSSIIHRKEKRSLTVTHDAGPAAGAGVGAAKTVIAFSTSKESYS